ncbi:MAG TPA: AAA family ATPase [Candidatus Limnocylindria bacterium]|nr:AAA family ATPase [Candidatus Limnocylindria bacterium]
MRIERIDVDGFGRIANASWELPPGLTVFRGENEAGKSTLMNAVRALLFGFDSTRNGRVWYPAVAGGKRGGRLVLVDRDGGRWTVHRHGEAGGTGSLSVEAPSGNTGGIETLDRLMRGADKDLFRSIFAFGLSELSDVSSLSADGIRGRIYGAATGLGGASAVDLETALRERLEELFKPSGQKPALNALFTRMDELRDRIAALSRAPEEHAAAHRARTEAVAAADALRTEADALRARTVRLEQSRSAAPTIAELADAEARLVGTDPSLDRLPPDSGNAGEARLAALEAAEARVRDADRAASDLEVELGMIAVDEPLLAAAAQLRALEADRAALAADEARRAEAAAAIARHDATVADQVTRTRVGSEDVLLALDDSIPAMDALDRHEADIERFTAAAIDAERLLRSLRDQPGTPFEQTSTGVHLDDAWAALRQISTARAADRSAVLPEAIGRPSGMVVVAAALLLVGWIVGSALGSGLVGALAGLALATAIGLIARSRPGFGALDAAALERAGLSADPSDEEIERRRDELSLERARREHGRATSTDLAQRLAAAEGDVARTAAERDHALDRWRAWLATAGLPADSTPAIARQTLAAAGVARRAAEDRRGQRAIVDGVDARAAEFESRAAILLDGLGIVPAASTAGRLHAALDRLEAAMRADERRRGLVAQQAKLAAQRAEIVATVDAARQALGEHLASAGVEGIEELRARAHAAAERRGIVERIRQLRERLVTVAGSQPVADALLREGATLDLAAVEIELGEVAARLRAVEDEERDLHARIGELGARIRDLEASADLGAARQELAVLDGRAQALARTWATTALAARLLAETRRRYERERQPDVVKSAQAYFRHITNGRYERITAPPGDASVRVETEAGDQLEPSELSRGTVEQLYLALRFGLIEEFARHAEPLPVVMDDILVNFDEARTERAASAIGQLAATHQVIFFTCREETARALDPGGERTRTLG